MKKSALTIFTLGLASSVAVGLAPQAALASEPSVPAVEQVATIQTSPSTLQGFEKCVTQADIPTPVETAVGSHLGSGISETVTAELRKQLNEGLVSQG